MKSITSATPAVKSSGAELQEQKRKVHIENMNRKIPLSPKTSSSDNTEELGDDEEIKFDLTNISTELKREPTVKWEIGCINITDRFRCYQEDILKRAEREGLKYENVYELLALSSVMVLCWPCPYPIFTNQEWEEITKTNPYTISEPPLPPEISSSLHDAVNRYLIGGDVFMERGNTELNKMV